MRKKTYLKKPEDVRKLLSFVIRQTLDDKISPNVANAVFYGCNTLLKTFDLIELGDEIEKLKTLYERRKQYGD